MKFQPHFLRVATLVIASILFIIAVAADHPVYANASQGESEAERFVLERIQAGEWANLDQFPEDKRELSASFIVRLLTKRDVKLKVPSQVITIIHAVLTDLDLSNLEIPYDVAFHHCIFEGCVDLHDTHFAKGISFGQSTFNGVFDLHGATIDFGLWADYCNFSDYADFQGVRVGHDFRIESCTFDTSTVFASTRVAGVFSVDKSKFNSREVAFDDMRVDGDFSVQGCTFRNDRISPKDGRPSRVGFVGAHFTDALLNDSSFDKIETIDFSRMQADFISFDGVTSKTPSEVKFQRMAFKMLSPVNAGELDFLLSHYNAEFYTDLETSWRTHGYPDEADKIFIAKRIAERKEQCNHFFSRCDSRGAWAWSYFQDKLAGYGERLQRLLYWSLAFLLIGILVFRSEKGMRIKDPKDAPHHAGRYNAFWYSLDLFLPIIKLGEADVWTPKDDRRWANLYRKVHIIIGSLFVPIGLAAWTGIIK